MNNESKWGSNEERYKCILNKSELSDDEISETLQWANDQMLWQKKRAEYIERTNTFIMDKMLNQDGVHDE